MCQSGCWSKCFTAEEQVTTFMQHLGRVNRGSKLWCLCRYLQVQAWAPRLSFLRARWTLCSPSSPAKGRGSAPATRSWKLWVTIGLTHTRLYIPVSVPGRTHFSSLCFLCPLQENRSMQQTMQALQNELDSLRADNIKLYEKIKFLQSYPGRVGLCLHLGPCSAGVTFWFWSRTCCFKPFAVFLSLQAGGSDDTVMRYSSQYEERLDPFSSFSKRVQHSFSAHRPLKPSAVSSPRLFPIIELLI